MVAFAGVWDDLPVWALYRAREDYRPADDSCHGDGSRGSDQNGNCQRCTIEIRRPDRGDRNNDSPNCGGAVSLRMESGNLVVNFSAPSGEPSNDWIGLSSIDAPDWWAPFSIRTQGQTSGSMTVALSSLPPGIYEARYYSAGTYAVAARSASLNVSTQGFSLSPAGRSIHAGSPVLFSWTAGTGKASGDYVGLYAAGAKSDAPVWWVPTSGLASGSSNGWPAPSTAGKYELRYIRGSTYYEVAKSVAIDVR